MSIGLATMGMFNNCCGISAGGGGAPPYKQNEQEHVTPFVLVKHFEMKTVKNKYAMYEQIKVRFLDDGGNI